ncbi:MAG TPA: hypothetical protein VHX60_16565 [Acidobacteriaceae bacterium]|jgi:hypothetical protein|nr:hypothetical protein [Acidobacteriaceae bacterium]
MAITLRPAEQVTQLRQFRAEVLMTSVQGQAYARTFETFKAELLRLVLQNQQLLTLEDQIIAQALSDFPSGSQATAQLSPALVALMNHAMDFLLTVASPELAAAVRTMRSDIDSLAGKPLRPTLEASNQLFETGASLG